MPIGLTIARLREQKGWTQGQLAIRTGIAATYIGRIEHDAHETINARNLSKLAMALGVSTEYLCQEAGWLPRRQPPTDPSSPEQKLLEIIRAIPTPSVRETVLEQFTWIAELARDADLARQPALKLVAEEGEAYGDKE